MNDTALQHRLVREYLRALDNDCAVLPASSARELREQIRAHLDEALGPQAGDQEVAETLRQLGSPGDLVAAAAAGKRPWPARLTWRRRRDAGDSAEPQRSGAGVLRFPI